MKVPSVEAAERLIEEAAKLNPGPWIEHNKTAGFCARTIAEKCDDMNPDTSYVMGLLHDIGRREGIMDWGLGCSFILFIIVTAIKDRFMMLMKIPGRE